LTVIGGMAWYRKRAKRLFMVSLSFSLFLVKGAFLAFGLYLLDLITVPREFAVTFDMMLLADVAILTVLYLALFRRS